MQKILVYHNNYLRYEREIPSDICILCRHCHLVVSTMCPLWDHADKTVTLSTVLKQHLRCKGLNMDDFIPKEYRENRKWYNKNAVLFVASEICLKNGIILEFPEDLIPIFEDRGLELMPSNGFFLGGKRASASPGVAEKSP